MSSVGFLFRLARLSADANAMHPGNLSRLLARRSWSAPRLYLLWCPRKHQAQARIELHYARAAAAATTASGSATAAAASLSSVLHRGVP